MRTAFFTLAISLVFFSMARAERISDFESPQDKEQRRQAIEAYDRSADNDSCAALVNGYLNGSPESPENVAKFFLKTNSTYLRDNLMILREYIGKLQVVHDGRMSDLTVSRIAALEDSFHQMIKTIKDDRTSFSHYYYLGSLRKGATELLSEPIKQLVSADDVLTYLSTASFNMVLGTSLPNEGGYGSATLPSYTEYDATQMRFVPATSHGI
jgi:hypothetical protein